MVLAVAFQNDFPRDKWKISWKLSSSSLDVHFSLMSEHTSLILNRNELILQENRFEKVKDQENSLKM